MIATKENYVELTVDFRRDGKRWIAACQELGWYVIEPTREEAQAKLVKYLEAGFREEFKTKAEVEAHIAAEALPCRGPGPRWASSEAVDTVKVQVKVS